MSARTTNEDGVVNALVGIGELDAGFSVCVQFGKWLNGLDLQPESADRLALELIRWAAKVREVRQRVAAGN